jgi:hypothetical protein
LNLNQPAQLSRIDDEFRAKHVDVCAARAWFDQYTKAFSALVVLAVFGAGVAMMRVATDARVPSKGVGNQDTENQLRQLRDCAGL